MDDKDKIFFDSTIPLILTNEVDSTIPLILTSEADSSLNLNNELLKIRSLIQKKYLNIQRDDISKERTSFDKRFISIKNTAKEIISTNKEKPLSTNNFIQKYENEVELLHEHKNLLQKNKLKSDIVTNQQMLIDHLKLNIKELKFNQNCLEKKLVESTNSNKNFEDNNNELNDNLNDQIKTNQTLHDTIKKLNSDHSEGSLNKEENNQLRIKIKFYQDENIRLSSELYSFQDKYKTIKSNFTEVELEKNNIYRQITELNNSLIKTNILGTPFVKKSLEEDSINTKVLNNISNINNQVDQKEKELTSKLEDQINDIFK